GVPPGRPNRLARLLCPSEPLARRVLAQLVEPVRVHGGGLRPRADDDEVAVPRRELLEDGEELLPLRAPPRAADPLLRLARGEIEPFERLLRLLPGARSARANRL